MNRLTRVERWLLAELEAHLSPGAAEILREQLRRANMICHDRGGLQLILNYFKPDRSGPDFSVKKFPAKRGTVEIAKAVYAFRFREYGCNFIILDGLLNVVETTVSKWTSEAHLRPRFMKFTLLNDPMIPSPARPAKPLLGWVAEWRDKYEIEEFDPPLPKREMKELLGEFDAVFPRDYLEFLSQTEGFSATGISVMGAEEIYDVSLEDGDYYLIAEVNQGEVNQGSIGVRRGSGDRALYFLSHEGLPSEPLGTSFRTALERYLPRVQ